MGVWLQSRLATETRVPCWPGGLLWGLAVRCGRAASRSGSSEAPDRPDPWLPFPPRLSLWRTLSRTCRGSTGSPCAGTEEGGPAHLLQDQSHTHTHTRAHRHTNMTILTQLINICSFHHIFSKLSLHKCQNKLAREHFCLLELNLLQLLGSSVTNVPMLVVVLALSSALIK